MNAPRVVESTTGYRYTVYYWTPESQVPSSTRVIEELNPQLAVKLRPDNAVCFSFSRDLVRETIVEHSPREPHELLTTVIETNYIRGTYYIDGTVYDEEGLRKLPNSRVLILKSRNGDTSRLVRTRLGKFETFYDVDSVIES